MICSFLLDVSVCELLVLARACNRKIEGSLHRVGRKIWCICCSQEVKGYSDWTDAWYSKRCIETFVSFCGSVVEHLEL